MADQKYIAVMFPYPSGAGLHVGHWYNYAIMDTYCRILRFQGFNVFQPFGYDAFGLPAENYARSIGRNASEVTFENIQNFRAEMQRMNTQYKEVLCTTDIDYQRCSQFLFGKLKDNGLIYRKDGNVNWCPSCETVIANEQVIEGKCERCSSAIETRRMQQTYVRITAYKQRLIDGLVHIDYPEKTKAQQRHWLENLHDWCISRQRKWGCPIPDSEIETMDTFVDSSFYFVRYCDPRNNETIADRSLVKQVDLYVGGNEHACAHLIYARFVNMFLFDIGITPYEEPFKKVVHQGMIRYNGEKMSKSKGNVVDPRNYDPDVLRMYLMFIGHYFDGGDWNDNNIKGIERFIVRMKTWLSNIGDDTVDISALRTNLFRLADSFKFNRCISEWMIFYNNNKDKQLTEKCKTEIITLLKLFAPSFDPTHQ